jgi:hypothetical protein
MLSIRRLFRPVLEWLEARLAPTVSVAVPPPPIVASIAIVQPPPVVVVATRDLAALDAAFAAGPVPSADFELIPPPAPKRFSMGLLEGASQRPPVMELPSLADNFGLGEEDTALRDLVFAEASISVFERVPEIQAAPDENVIVVAA